MTGKYIYHCYVIYWNVHVRWQSHAFTLNCGLIYGRMFRGIYYYNTHTCVTPWYIDDLLAPLTQWHCGSPVALWSNIRVTGHNPYPTPLHLNNWFLTKTGISLGNHRLSHLRKLYHISNALSFHYKVYKCNDIRYTNITMFLIS